MKPNVLAATSLYQTHCIVVDFGTALTFTTVNNEKKILGVAIAPGIYTALGSLIENAVQLPQIHLEKPASPLGKNTVQAIQAGMVYGYIGMVEGLVSETKKKLAGIVTVIATGGLSGLVAPHTKIIDVIKPNLTLDGLRIAGELVAGKPPKVSV
jgi:type III pantothenate kinase